jgi:MoxR-like ATPase
MQEKFVTIAGANHDLPPPFHVLATQNPIEQEGTYPLPEAQLDRFLLKIDVDYPDAETERRVLIETTQSEEQSVSAVLNAEKLIFIQQLVRDMPVPEKIVSSILDLVRSARPEQSEIETVRQNLEWGPSPRAGQALMLTCRARALLRGRYAPSIDDVEALAEPVLGHRMELKYDPLQRDRTVKSVIDELVRQIL